MTAKDCLSRVLLALVLATGAAAVRAEIDVEIEGVSGDIEDNVRALLSLQRYSRSTDLDAATVERLGERANREVESALRPFGYYEPKVTSEVTPDGRDWRVVVRIDPGPPVLLVASSIEIEGPGRDEPFFAPLLDGRGLRPGRQLDHRQYEGVKGDLTRLAAAHGYLDAQLAESDLLVDVRKREASARLRLVTGQRYRFGATRIEQDVIEPELLKRYVRYRDGDYYESAKLLRTQFALDDTAYFSGVEVAPEARDRETLTVPITIRASAAKRDRYTVAIGYATDTRARGTLAWDNRRVNRRGHRFRIEAQASNVRQSLTGTYVLPWEDPALEKLAFETRLQREERADLESVSARVRTGLTQALGGWQRVLFLDTTRIRTKLLAEVEPRFTTVVSEQTDTLIVPGLSYSRLPRGFTSSATALTGFYAEVVGSHSTFFSDANFLQVRVRDERRFRLAPKWDLLLRGEVGASAVNDFSELPADYRFFAGGDRSVRGYALDELSPVDESGAKVGGRHLVIGSVEIERALPRNFAIAAFVDGGNAINDFSDPLQYSVGIGVRWKLPVVSLGIDVAKSVSESDRSPRIHLNIAPNF